MAQTLDMLRVLLVEDEEAHAELISRAFEDAEHPWEIRLATCLAEAREILAEERIDVVLTDLMLPDGRGIELIAERNATVQIPVVLMTSHGDEQSAVEAMRIGAADYVVKSPDAFDQMPHTLERIVREWRHSRELEALERQVRQAQKLEAIGRLTSGVAHDFNNLLMGILGCADLAMARMEPDHPAYQYLREVRRATEGGAGLTNRLLTFSRKRQPTHAVVDLNRSVAETQRLLHPMIGEEVSLSVALSEEGPLVRCDRVEVEQILVNLVVNARDALQPGGRVEVATDLVEVGPPPHPRLLGLSPGTYATLQVRDTGSGIEPAVIERIFEPFFTTKEVGKGTGLGLSTIHGIVRDCGGTIDVDSEIGRGTTFTVYLPAVDSAEAEADARQREEQDAAKAAAALPVRGPERPSRGQTVLLVEDEPLVQMSVRGYLEADGFRVLAASRGDEALALVEHYDDPIDLIVSDVSLPGTGGPELVERIRKQRPEIGAMFITAHDIDALRAEGRVGPTTPMLRKPFGHDDLLRTVHEALSLATAPTEAEAEAEAAPKPSPPRSSESPPAALDNLDSGALTEPSDTLTVLLVDDHGLTRRTLKVLLEDYGYSVVAAGTMHSAIEAYDAHPEVQIVLSDVSLPDGDGRELLDTLRARDPDLPVILLTGRSAQDPSVAQALRLPGVDYMLKPIDVDELCVRITDALQG